jgi:heme exporter protein B
MYSTRILDMPRAALLISEKDLRTELQRPYEVISIFAFAAGSILIASLALSGTARVLPDIIAAVLWIILFFVVILTFTTAFMREADQETLGGLKTLPCSPMTILVGKTIYGTAIVFFVESLLIPCTILFFHLDLKGILLPFLLVYFLGSLGLSIAGSFVSGLVIYSEEKTILLSFLIIPICMPSIVPSVTATREIIGGTDLVDVIPELRLLIAFLLLITAVMILTFSYVLDE